MENSDHFSMTEKYSKPYIVGDTEPHSQATRLVQPV